MKKFLKWVGIIFGGLMGIMIVLLGVISFKAGQRRWLSRSDGCPPASDAHKVMNDEELQAVWLYLGSLPKKDYGNR